MPNERPSKGYAGRSSQPGGNRSGKGGAAGPNRRPDRGSSGFSGKPKQGRERSGDAGGKAPQQRAHGDKRDDRPQQRERTGYAGTPRRNSSKASPARKAALEVIRAVREREAFAQELISAHIDDSRLTPEDRAFATRLCLGVVSSVGTLDEVIDRSLRSPSDVQDNVRDALRLSTYEIIFLDKTPHAAVDQGVELVRSVQPKAAGLANAVLRKVVAMKEEFPFGNPRADLHALARLHAFPDWLAKRAIADLGVEEAIEYFNAANEPAPLFLAVNAAKATDNEVRAAFVEAGTQIIEEAVSGKFVAGCFRVADNRALQHPSVKKLFSQGKILISDAASQAVAANVLPPKMPRSFLEVGAGRATKTILLQSDALRAYGSQMELVTLDNHTFKTKLLRERTQRYGTQVDQAVTGDARHMAGLFPNRRFDEIFIDAPCSGLGTLRRHPEIRWRTSEQDIASFAQTQLALLQAAAPCVEVGGSLAYATCTITHTENNAVVKAFLESEQGASFQLAPIDGRACFSTRMLPGSCDAHFAVRMERKA